MRFMLSLLVFLAAPASALDWTVVPVGTANDLNVVSTSGFSGALYVAGDGGFVTESDFTRTTWTPVNIGTTADILSILEPSGGQVWMGGGMGSVRVKSGTSWLVRSIPDAAHDYSLWTRDSGRAFAAGTGGAIYRTDNGGVNWTLKPSGTTSALHAGAGFVCCYSYAAGDNGTILYTSDAGEHWTAQVSGTTQNLYDIMELGYPGALAVGAGGTILRTTDAGITWTKITSGTTATLYAVGSSGLNSNWIVAVGAGGTAIKSTDGGLTWCSLNTGTTANLYGVIALDNAEYWACGAGGVVVRTTTGGGACTPTAAGDPDRDGAGYGFQVLGVSRAGARARLALTVPHAQQVRVDALDVCGRHVAAAFEGRVEAGVAREVSIDTRAWPAGVYVLRAEGDGFVAARRLVVVR
jgi:photosystem II stability/assembly factor-like uncharacterized protein